MELGISTDVFVVIVLAIMLGGLIFFLVIKKFHREITLLKDALIIKQSRATQIGKNTALGDIHQFIGDFALLAEYDDLILLSTTSRQPSLDVIGIKEERMDFIEIKKKGARMTSSENKVRQIIESKNVRYIVKEVEIPTSITVEDRELPQLRN